MTKRQYKEGDAFTFRGLKWIYLERGDQFRAKTKKKNYYPDVYRSTIGTWICDGEAGKTPLVALKAWYREAIRNGRANVKGLTKELAESKRALKRFLSKKWS